MIGQQQLRYLLALKLQNYSYLHVCVCNKARTGVKGAILENPQCIWTSLTLAWAHKGQRVQKEHI